MKFTTFLLPFLMMVPAGATSCSVSYYVYPSGTYDPTGGTLLNGDDISSLPCSANIEARVTDCIVSGSVRTNLSDDDGYDTTGNENHAPYFLYGNDGGVIKDGHIPGAGQYTIKTEVNGQSIGELEFTIEGACTPPVPCAVDYYVWSYDQNTEELGPLIEGDCYSLSSKANIEARMRDDCTAEGTVTIELYKGSYRIEARGERKEKYFLWGNTGSIDDGDLDVFRGDYLYDRDDYSIRTKVNGVWTTKLSFEKGNCS